MHAQIAELGLKLQAILDNPPQRPTTSDRKTLMSIRDDIKKLAEDDLEGQDRTDQHGLYVLATVEANRQEDFWEKNGEKWAAEHA